MVRRLDDKALHTEYQPAANGIDKCRLQPGAVLIKKFFGERRKELHHVEERPLLFDYRMNCDVLEHDRRRHAGAFPQADVNEQC